jgi:geranylgeranyl reductase family protein
MGSVREWDVIVVGAGPAGATAAAALAQKGRDVLLLDRQQFPRDKACGDGIPTSCIEIMYRLGMREKVLDAVKQGDFYELNQMRLISPKGHLIEAKFKQFGDGIQAYVVPRVLFDVVIQQHAVESGAEFCQADVKGPILENGRVCGVQARVNGSVTTLRAKVVIGADGVTSAIMRALRPPAGQHVDWQRAVALRAYLDDFEEFPHEIEFYLYQAILPGYAWIFPIGKNRVNIGLGMRLDHFRHQKHNLKRMLNDFMAMPDIKKRLRPGSQVRDVSIWQLNFGSQKNLQHTYDGALLIGDAAGLINPLTGGGIHNAMISAELAAETVDEALKQGDTSRPAMKVYEQRCHEEMWDGMRRSYLLQKWLMRFPFVIDFLAKQFRENSQFAQIFLAKL